MMTNFVCIDCSKTFFDEKLPHRGSICFGCHIKSVRLGFTYGKDDFHGPTIGERARKTVADAKANGITAELVTNHM